MQMALLHQPYLITFLENNNQRVVVEFSLSRNSYHWYRILHAPNTRVSLAGLPKQP
jgi:hypothetical protein